MGLKTCRNGKRGQKTAAGENEGFTRLERIPWCEKGFGRKNRKIPGTIKQEKKPAFSNLSRTVC